MKPSVYIRDMTQGPVLRHLLSFSIPLLVGNLFQQFYHLVDTMVVGHFLGDSAIAAIGATVSLYSLMINFACDLNNGYGIVATQRFGARNVKEMKLAIAGMIELNSGCALILTGLAMIFLQPLMRFMNTPAEIFDDSYAYIAVVTAGIPVTIAYNMFASILRAVGNSRSPLYFLILSSVINVILDIVLVTVLPMGLSGVAVATVIAQLVSAVIAGGYVWKRYRAYLPNIEHFRVPFRVLRQLFATGFAMALTCSVVEVGTVWFQRSVNLLGEVLIAAHSAARRILMMMIQPIITISVSNMTFVGQNFGAKKKERIRSSIRLTLWLELAWCTLALAIAFIFGEAIIRFTTGTANPDVLKNAVLSLRIHFVLYPVLGVLFCLRNTMQAIGQKVVPVLSSCIELAMKIFAASWLVPKLGFLGVCITEPVTWVLMVFFLAGAYMLYSKRWLTVLEPST